MRYFKIILNVFAFVFILQDNFYSQTCPAPSINAQAGTGPSTTICSGQCAALTATVVPVNSTTSYSVGAVPYAPFPFTGGTSPVGAVDDVWSGVLNIGFSFCYFGNNFTQLLVGTNGEITFNTANATLGESFQITAVLPNLTEHVGNSICGPYRDIDPSVGGLVRTYTTGVAPCRKFVAYWSNVPLYNCNTPHSTFQIVLHESSNIIEVNIPNSAACATWQNGRGLIGIQNAAGTTVVAPPTRNVLTAWTANNESWRFTPTGAPTYTVNWAGPAGFTATGLTATPCPTATGNYTATMLLQSCAAGTVTSFTSAVQVSVTPTPTLVATASPTSICTGGSSTLTASGATTYTWNPGGLIGTPVIVNPVVTTLYTVTGQTGLCTGTKTVQVVVNPTVTATASSNTICSGGSATLTGSGATSYTWNPGNITSAVVVVSPTITTNYTLTGLNGSCSSSTVIPIVVTAPAVVSAFNLSGTVCAGTTASLVATGALTYTWNPGNIVGNIITVTPTVNTTYTVIGAVGSCTSQATLLVPVNNGPTITVVASPTAICPGNSATLTASGALSYTWNPGSIISPSLVVNPLITTTYSVTGTNAIGCTSTKTISEVVSPVPSITISPASPSICIGTSGTLTASGATSYTWNPGNLTGASVVVNPTVTTVYSIVGSNGTCTSSAISTLIVVPNPTVTASTSTTSVCSGNSATLTGFGATTYTWNPGNLVGTTVAVSPTITTTYTVIGSSASCTNSAIVTVTVNNGPALTAAAAPATICGGSSATLSSTGALSYTWNPGSLAGGTVIVTPAATTLYSVTGNNAFGCLTTKTVNLVVTPNPTVIASASSLSICIGSNATLTATGTSTYTWNPGALTGSNVVVTPTVNTTYTVNGSNSGCSSQATITINVVPIPTVNAVVSPTAVCSGATATLTGSGALTYTWNPGNISGNPVTVNPTVTTIYTVTGSNGSCISTKTVNLIVNPNPTVTAIVSPTNICAGSSATLSSTGATSYTWNPGALLGGTVTVTPAATTLYTVTASNGFGCTATKTVNLIVTPIPTLVIGATPAVICAGSSTTLTATGATTYTWNPGALTGGTVIVSPAVTTTYVVTGANGLCTSTKSITVIVNPTPTITAIVSPTSICAGSSATLSSSGAASYTWNPGALIGGTVTVTPATTTLYTVTASNGFGCTATKTVNLIVTPIPNVSVTASPANICVGGSSTLTATGATTYSWNPGSLTGASIVVSPTVTTTYTVTGTNASCSNTQAITVTVNPTPTLIVTATPTAICAGGSSTLTVSGATAYLWQPGSLTAPTIVVSPTITTTYTVTGTTAFGCSSSKTISILVNPLPSLTITASPTAICSSNSTTLTGTASGPGPFVATWNPGAVVGFTDVVSPLITTTYTWSVTNGLGCSNSKTITINVTPTPTVIASASNLTLCAGSSTTLNASGATTYTWNPGALTGASILVTPSVTTIYTVTGSNGACTSSAVVAILVNPTPTITAAVSPTAICAGSSATLSSSGAASYTWNPGALIGGTVTVTPATTTLYTVTASNGFGCTATKTVNLIVTPVPTVIATASPASNCAGATVTLSASGATTYTWNPGSLTGASVAVNPTVTTTYTVTGANAACSNTQGVTVTVNPTPTLIVTATPSVICVGGSSTLTVSGAAAYVWQPGSLTNPTIVVSPTVTTTYTVTGTTAFGCSSSKTITILVNPLPSLTITAAPIAICSGNSTTLTGTISGPGPFLAVWNPGAVTGFTDVVSPITNTTYTWSVTNGAGCTNTKTITINVTPTPTISVGATPAIICSGTSTTLTATGATSYTWSPGALIGGTVTVSPSVTTTYTVSGSNGACVVSKTISIIVNPTTTITAAASPTGICTGSSATLSSSGATSYTWNPGAITGATITVTPSVTTSYTVTASNGFGCIATNFVTVSVTPTPTLIIAIPLAPICAGNNATLTAMGATTYTWLPGGSTATVLVTPLLTSTIFTLTGSNGICQVSQTVGLTPSPNPTITATASPTTVCAGSTITLMASGATTYSWSPIATSGATVTATPTVNTTYTVIGTDAAGCSGQAIVNASVSPAPTITAAASATSICVGTAVTLTASGSGTYTWNPTGLTTATITDTPTITTTYTVSSNNGFGCTGTSTITIVVNSVPSLTLSPLNATICSGYATTLTAMGATNYTWLPSGNTSSTSVETPTTNTTYTVIGQNGVCSATSTVAVFVNPLPANVTAATSGSITCTAPTVTLTGSSTSTNVNYAWTGPGSFTSVTQNPTVNLAGTYTLNVIDNSSGCVASVTLNVPTDSSIPSVTATTSGSITCVTNSVTLNVTTTATNVTYSWSGPGSFTSTAQTFTSTQAGNYTVTVTDLTSTCATTVIVTVGIHTNVAVTASITPATCTGSVSNNNGTISLSNFTVTDKYDYVSGSTYTGTATYITASSIPTTGIVTNTLSNPTGTVAYTIRIFDGSGCIKDTTLILVPINCQSNNSLGLAKAVSAATLNTSGNYDLTYKVVVKNYGTIPLNNVTLIENLNATFPLPSTFTVTSAPLITSTGSSLTINPTFDGNLQTSLTTILLSTLNAGQSDTIVFGVSVSANGAFGPFKNTVTGFANPSVGVFVSDSSNTGTEPDPDTDLNPTNNNVPTPVQFTPNRFFGLTKTANVGAKLNDGTYDVTFTITVHNLGNDTLKNVTVKDSLFEKTIKHPATYTMKTAPVATGSLSANNLFNGNSDINLLVPGSSIITPGFTNTIIFTINVHPDTVTVFANSAFGNAIGTASAAVADTSNSGTNPDVNGNGIWNEPSDNIPTVFILPNSTFFIPEGFSPDGDGKNDFFVIKGLPPGVDNVFTVYNRWGNKVYTKSNYDNTWNGTANVNGTVGTDKLPPGTYYYILEFKGGDIKTTNGFIVLQY